MARRLNTITDWATLAQQANWRASTLANNCGVSLRTLERHFLRQTGKGPHEWLEEERQESARRSLQAGQSVKATALNLGYKGQALGGMAEAAARIGVAFNPDTALDMTSGDFLEPGLQLLEGIEKGGPLIEDDNEVHP